MEIYIQRIIKCMLLSLIILTGINYNAAAQCTLGKGDVIITGYDLQDGGTPSGQDDQFSFLLLRQIPAGTEIFFTDFGWTSANAFQPENQATTDGVIKWTSDKSYPAGTEIHIFCKYQLLAFDKTNAPAGTVTGIVESVATRGNPIGPNHQYMSLGLFSGDQIFAFTGSVAAPTLLAGISMNHDNGSGTSGWDATLTAATFAADRSVLPPALSSGAQNLSIVSHDDAGDPTFNTGFTARYKKTIGAGITAGLPTVILAQLNNMANWELKTDGTSFSPFLTGETFTVSGTSFTVNPVDKLSQCAGTGTSFTATAANFCSLKWQLSTDGGTNYADITDAGVYSGSTTATLTISNVNGLNNNRYRLNANGSSGIVSSTGALLTLSSQVITLSPVLASGTYKTAYSEAVTVASGGGAPYVYSLASGTLPTGLTLSPQGVLSGTPTATGSYNFNVSVTSACVSSGSQAFSLVIAPKAVIATFAAVTKAYNGDAVANIVFNPLDAGSGVVAPDVISVTYTSAAYNTAGVGINKPVTLTGLALTGANSASYTLNPVVVTGTITAAPIVPSLVLPITKIYDGNTIATLTGANYSFTGKVGTEDVALNNPATGNYALKDIGSRLVSVTGLTLTGTDAANYTLSTTSISATGTINKAVITPVLAGTIAKVYDGNTTAALTGANYSFTGKVGTENVALNNPATGNYALKDIGSRLVSVTGLTLTGTDAANYTLSTTSISATGTINQAVITPVLAGTITKVYDGNTTAALTGANYSFTGKVGTDDVSLNNPATGNYALKDIGNRLVSVTGLTLTGTDAANYTLSTTSISATGTINQAVITPLLAGTITKVYDGNTTAALTGANYSFTGKIGTENVALNNPATGNYALKDIGNRLVSVTGLTLTGADAGNYTLSTNSLTAPGTITLAVITPVLAGTITKVYDGNTTAALTGANYSFTGKVGTDDVSLNNPATGNYALKDIGNRLVSVTGLTLTGADAGNYTLSTNSLTAPGTINQAIITPVLAGTITKVYDGNTTAALTGANYSFTGKVGTEDVVLNNPAIGNYALKDIGSRLVSVTGLTLTGTDAANYALSTTSISATGTINQAVITPLLAGTITKVYDGNTTAALTGDNYSFTGKVGSEDVVLNNPATGTYALKDIGNHLVSVTGLTLTGNDAGNYTLSTTSLSAPGTITLAVITPVLVGTITKVYDGNTTAALTGANYSFTGKVGTDDVSLNNPATGNYTLKDVGNRLVSVTGLALTGANSANYTLSATSISATGTITAATIVPVLAGTITKVYDGNIIAALTSANYSFTGKLGTDNVALNNPSTGTYDNKNAAASKSVIVNGITLTGADAGNYVLSATSLNSTNGIITTKPLSITADDKEMIQGTTLPALTLTYSGFVNGENTSQLTTAANVSTTANSSSLAGNYPITVNGAVAANYAISFVNGILTIKPGVPTGISLAAVELYENRPAGTLAGTLSSTSLDPNATFTYTLVSGSGDTDNALFDIAVNQLKTKTTLNFQQKSTYSIRVRSTSQYGLSLDKQFNITLIDVNEAPTLDAIASLTQCITINRQTVALTGISPGPESAQTTMLSIISDKPAMFSELNVIQENGGKGTLTYRLANSTVSGIVTITVTVKDNGGTANGGVDTYSKTFTLTVNPLPVLSIVSSAGLEISKGITTKLTASGGTSYVWANASGIISGQNTSELTIRPSQTASYTVTATNASGCTNTQQITITVSDDYKTIAATNMMTPNGDGVNDYFVVNNIDLYPNNTVTIYDMTGKTLYKTRSYKNNWDGSINGNPLQTGNYYYIIEFGDGKTNAKKGFFTVVN